MTLEELFGFAIKASIFFIVFKLGTAANAKSIFDDEHEQEMDDEDAEAEHPPRRHTQDFQLQEHKPENQAGDRYDEYRDHHGASLPACDAVGFSGGGSPFRAAIIALVLRLRLCLLGRTTVNRFSRIGRFANDSAMNGWLSVD